MGPGYPRRLRSARGLVCEKRGVLSLASADGGMTTARELLPPDTLEDWLTLAAVKQLGPLVAAHDGDRIGFVILVIRAGVSAVRTTFSRMQGETAAKDRARVWNTEQSSGGPSKIRV